MNGVLRTTLLVFFLSHIAWHLSAQYNMASGTITTCSGTFYDNGGSASNYTNGCNITETFTSSAGNCLTFLFTTFLTQAGNDVLTIYDGPTTSSPVIGNFSGLQQPGTIISSTSSLTFSFVSNGSNSQFGWSATISCSSCGTSYFMNTNSTSSTCDGLIFDSGGSGNYGNNENYVRTFCSSNSNCLQLNFYSLGLASGDSLKIYDGPSTASTLINAYTNTTATPPNMLSSTGCLTVQIKTNSSGVSSGFMAAIQCYTCPAAVNGTTYTQPTIGLGGSYIGGPMVATCSGTFEDDNGGAGGNYSNSVNDVYQTFCPGVVNNCLRTQFYSVDIKSNDKLSLKNGPMMDCYPFNAATNNIVGTCNSYQECMALGWGPVTSNDQSGCITFIFSSNGTSSGSGWVATFDCIPCLAGPNGTDNNDCSRSSPLCANTSFSDASTGPGVIADVSDPCLVSETYSNWYTFDVYSSGTLGFTIDPLSTGAGQPDDYDWALYGPNVSCGGLGNAIRCSVASTQGESNNAGNAGNTGISTTQNNSVSPISNDLSENANGNGWVNDLNVTVGQTYYLCISKWSAGGSGFNLTWNLTNGASLECPVILPVELTSFTCDVHSNFISLDWISSSEFNNSSYSVEKSYDGENYEWLTSVPGKNLSTTPTEYYTIDNHPFAGVNYYRLKQTDIEGNEQILKTTACTFSNPDDEVLMEVFDLSGRIFFTEHIITSDFESKLRSLKLPAGVYMIATIQKNGVTDLVKYLRVN